MAHKTRSGEPRKLTPPQKFKPLDPDKPLAPFRVPALKTFDRDMPGQLTLEDMGVIEVPEQDPSLFSAPHARAGGFPETAGEMLPPMYAQRITEAFTRSA